MNKFKERLVEAREDLGLTQKTVADAMGVTPTAVSYWETGKSEPSYDTLIKLSEFFGVGIYYLLGVEYTQIPADSEKMATQMRRAIKILEDACKDEHI